MSERDPDGRVSAAEPISRLLRELRARPEGLSNREAERRLLVYGENRLARRHRRRWLRGLIRQFTHPLALLLWAAAVLALVAKAPTLSVAILGVIVLNGVLAFVQELQAERAVEALARYLPEQAAVLRDGVRHVVPIERLVPGDVLLVAEGDRISADARLLSGVLEVDMSALTGESVRLRRRRRLAAAAASDLRDRAAAVAHAGAPRAVSVPCLGR